MSSLDEMCMFGDDSEEEEEESNGQGKAEEKGQDIHEKEDKRPILASEVRIVDNVGGRRGLFATCDLGAGFLVLSERPSFDYSSTGSSFEMSEDEDCIFKILETLCQDEKAVTATKSLHPQSLSDSEGGSIEAAKERIGTERLDAISKASDLDANEIIRIYLTLEHNGFNSGLYKELSLINHSCDPNCVKYSPKPGSLGGSEVWTTRPIKADEEFTICYCSPLETTQAPMRAYLLQQHKFQCQCLVCQVDYPTNDTTDVDSSSSNNINPPTPPWLPQFVEIIENMVQGMKPHLQVETIVFLQPTNPDLVTPSNPDSSTATTRPMLQCPLPPEFQSLLVDNLSSIQEEINKMEHELEWKGVEHPLDSLGTYCRCFLLNDFIHSPFSLLSLPSPLTNFSSLLFSSLQHHSGGGGTAGEAVAAVCSVQTPAAQVLLWRQ